MINKGEGRNNDENQYNTISSMKSYDTPSKSGKRTLSHAERLRELINSVKSPYSNSTRKSVKG